MYEDAHSYRRMYPVVRILEDISTYSIWVLINKTILKLIFNWKLSLKQKRQKKNNVVYIVKYWYTSTQLHPVRQEGKPTPT